MQIKLDSLNNFAGNQSFTHHSAILDNIGDMVSGDFSLNAVFSNL